MHQPAPMARIDATLAVAPGAFYREVAKSGGDGRQLRAHASELGFETALIPCESMGSLASNGGLICDWLQTRRQQFPAERIILASLSKGAGDVKTALARPEARQAFANVAAWINISGAASGAPVVNWFQQRKIRWWMQDTLFRLRGLDFDVVRQLKWGPSGLLHAPLELPAHMKMVTVAGFPLTAHASHFILRSYRHKMKEYGPSDGVALLTDVAALPGGLAPVWGADHYLRPGWDISLLIRAVAIYLAEELQLFESDDRTHA